MLVLCLVLDEMEVRDNLLNFDNFVWANFSVVCRNRVVAGGAKLAGLSHLKDLLIHP
jgi:hypothetical protein